jgi:HTH-type transcriptional regulator / antitoxin HigA
MNPLPPAQVFPPGDRLKEELEARGWSQADLAEILGRPPRLVSEIITAKRAITPETAQGLGEALGTGPELWMNLESQYQLSQSRVPNEAIAKRAQIYGRFPVKEMQKRGWLGRISSLSAIENQLKDYFRIPTLDAEIRIAHAAKKTSYDKVSMLQVAWLMRARQLLAEIELQPYAASELGRLHKDLRACVEEPTAAANVPALLANAGIQLLIIQPLPGSKIDGACFWIDENPVIVLTLRYDRHDIFWHALFHELNHIEHGEGKTDPIVDSNMMRECSGGPEMEKRANRAAASRLISEAQMETFINECGPYFSVRAILNLASKANVHPGIVVGQLQHRELVAWSSLNSLKTTIRDLIVPFALTDGFGK